MLSLQKGPRCALVLMVRLAGWTRARIRLLADRLVAGWLVIGLYSKLMWKSPNRAVVSHDMHAW